MRTTATRRVSDPYMKLIMEFPLRKIRTTNEHQQAKAIMIALFAKSKRTRGTQDYLDVLKGLIRDYEGAQSYEFDRQRVSVTDLVQHRIQERGLSITSTAREVGVSQSNLSEMLSGKRGWSKTAIRGLTKLFGIPAQRFLDD